MFEGSHAPKLLLAILILGALGAGSYYFMRPKVNLALIETQIKQLSETIAAEAQQQGSQASLTYDKLESDGKKAIISGLTFTMREQDGHLTVTTPEMHLTSRNFAMTDYRVEVPQNILIDSNEGKASIAYNKALTIDTSYTRKDGLNYYAYDVLLPSQITLTSDKNAPAGEGETPAPVHEELVLTMDEGATVKGMTESVSRMPVTIVMKAAHIKGVRNEKPGIGIDNIDVAYDMAKESGDKHRLTYKINVDRIAVPEEMATGSPYDFRLDAVLTGDLPGGIAAMPQMPQGEMTVKINDLTLSTANYKLAGMLDFASKPDDPLPVGSGNITVEHFDFILTQLEKSGMIDPQTRNLANAMVTKITGKGLDENTNLSIALKREPGQSFYIGNSTMEELMGVMQAGALPPQTGAPGDAPAAGVPAENQPD